MLLVAIQEISWCMCSDAWVNPWILIAQCATGLQPRPAPEYNYLHHHHPHTLPPTAWMMDSLTYWLLHWYHRNHPKCTWAQFRMSNLLTFMLTFLNLCGKRHRVKARWKLLPFEHRKLQKELFWSMRSCPIDFNQVVAISENNFGWTYFIFYKREYSRPLESQFTCEKKILN